MESKRHLHPIVGKLKLCAMMLVQGPLREAPRRHRMQRRQRGRPRRRGRSPPPARP